MGVSIERFPVHLGLGARAEPLPEFTGGMEWYQSYSADHAADGREGRLVSLFTFTENWTSWEMHPAGDEVVICVAGAMTLHQERPDGSRNTVHLGPGEYAINTPGVWHTADVEGSATAVFITAGEGTQHRER